MEEQADGHVPRSEASGESSSFNLAAAEPQDPQSSGNSWTGMFNRRIGNGSKSARSMAKSAIQPIVQCVQAPDSPSPQHTREVPARPAPPDTLLDDDQGLAAGAEGGPAELERLAAHPGGHRKPLSQQELCKLACKMSKGVEIKDRFWRLIPFKSCFIGEDAVKWLVQEEYAADASEAVSIGNAIHDLGLLEHVTRDHKFKDAYLFYRFSLDCMSESATNDGMSDARTEDDARARKEQTDMVFLHAAHIHKLQRRVSDVTNQSELLKFSIAAVVEAAGQNQRAMEAMRAEIKQLQAFVAGLCFTFAGVLAAQSTGGLVMYLVTVAALVMGAVMLHSNLVQHQRLAGVQKEAVEVLQALRFVDEGAGTLVSSKPVEGQTGMLSLQRVMSSTLASCISQPASAPANQDAAGEGLAVGSRSLLPTMQEIKDSPDCPLLLRLKPDLPYQRTTDSSNPRSIPINRSGSFAFETELFEGRAMLWVAGLPSSPAGLFKGRQRKTSLVVQGRFKRQLPYCDVFTGQEFFRPLLDLPAKWMINVLLRIARRLSPSSMFGLLDAPHILTPLVAGAQSIHVTAAGSGEDPPDLDAPAHENMQPVAGSPAEAQMTSVQRKKWFSSAKNREKRFFETHHIYTFHFWQHLLDLSTYELDMGVAAFDIASSLDGQPLQLMVKQQSTGRSRMPPFSSKAPTFGTLKPGTRTC